MIRTLAVVLCACCVVFAQAQTNVRPNKVGDVHVYETQNKAERSTFEEAVTIVALEGDRLRTKHARSDKAAPLEGTYGHDWSTLVSGSSGLQLAKPLRMVALPPEVGKQWEDETEAVAAGGAKVRIKFESKVTAAEKVVTPAGEFETYRVESTGYLSGLSFQGGWGMKQIAWYAPAINRVVRIEFREQRARGNEYVTVLKSFKPAE